MLLECVYHFVGNNDLQHKLKIVRIKDRGNGRIVDKRQSSAFSLSTSREIPALHVPPHATRSPEGI